MPVVDHRGPGARCGGGNRPGGVVDTAELSVAPLDRTGRRPGAAQGGRPADHRPGGRPVPGWHRCRGHECDPVGGHRRGGAPRARPGARRPVGSVARAIRLADTWAASRGARRCRRPTWTPRCRGPTKAPSRMAGCGGSPPRCTPPSICAGLPSDSNGAVASSPRFARSASEWAVAAEGWLDDPMKDRGIVMSSLLLDARVVWGDRELHTVPAAFGRMRVEHPNALRLQLLDALCGQTEDPVTARHRGPSRRDVRPQEPCADADRQPGPVGWADGRGGVGVDAVAAGGGRRQRSSVRGRRDDPA